MQDNITLCGLTAARGEKLRGFVQVPGSDVQIPLVLINGERPGPTLLLTAGVHGGEYPGIAALAELGRELEPAALAGAVVMLYPVNLQGFWKRCEFVVPEDGKNLNRVFPGSPRGTLAERTAHLLITEFFPAADFYADLHSGDIHESLCPHVYYPGQPNERVEAESKKIAQALDVGYMVRSLALGGAYNYAASEGIPSILIERGCCGMCPPFAVEAYRNDLLRVMRALGMTELRVEPSRSAPTDVSRMTYLEAPFDGCWFSKAASGAFVKKGDVLGVFKNFFGETTALFRAQHDGVVLYICSALAAPEGTALAVYGEVQKDG